LIDHDVAAELDALAEAIARLKPISARRPDEFYEERSEIASRARSIAQRCRTGTLAVPAAADVPAPVGRQRTSAHRVQDPEGRSVLVLTRRAAAPAQ
jgi:hypothetical protein